MQTKIKYLWILIYFTIIQNAANANDSIEPTVEIAKITDISMGTKQEMRWLVTTNTLNHQPRWDGLTSEVPLSSAKAAAKCLVKVQELHKDIKDWVVQSILIRNLSCDPKFRGFQSCSNIWFYQIRVIPRNIRQAHELEDLGRDQNLFQVILMDGTVVEPNINPPRQP